MYQIEVINWQGRKVPAQMDQPDKTIFLADNFSPRNANLVVFPLEGDPAAHLKKLSALIRTDVNVLKSRLSARGFMMLMRSEKFEDIASTVTLLNQHGYSARMIRDNMFFRAPLPRRVISAEFGGDGATFTVAGGATPFHVPLNEPIFCVIADIKSVKRLGAIKKGDSKPAAAPVSGKAFSFSSILEPINNYHCDIYVPYKWHSFRIESDKFNYSCLGGAASKYSAENLAMLMDRLAALPLRIVWDDRYPETAVVGMRTQIEMASSSNTVASASLHTTDEEAPFNFYSRFRYILELAGGFKCFNY